jgi:uncharacterized protein (TIGR02453 family)
MPLPHHAMTQHLSKDFFDFFIELAANNHKDWFDTHRARYEKVVKAPFERLVGDVITEMGKIDKQFVGIAPKDCIFRINRDIRFSKDKTPYKSNRSAAINPGGKKDMSPLGFYFEIGPDTCGIYSGMYQPEKEQVQQIRAYIADHLKDLEKVLQEPQFIKTYGTVHGEKNKRLPAEWTDAGAKQPLMFNTQFYLMHQFEPELVLESDIVKYMITQWQKAMPFHNFLLKALNQG